MTFARIALLPLCLVALTGCDTVRSTLGLEHSGPNEFDVATAAPLSMPPDYNLRPPEPGAPRPQEVSASAQAQQALLGTSAKATGTSARATGGEDALLRQVGVAPTAVTATALPQDKAASSGASPQQQKMENILFGTPTAPADSRPGISMEDRGGLF